VSSRRQEWRRVLERRRVLHKSLFLAGLELLGFALDGLDQQRQAGVQTLLLLLLSTAHHLHFLLLCRLHFLFPVVMRFLLGPLAPLLSQDALGAAGRLVAGVGRVQVEEVGGEQGLEPGVRHVHLGGGKRERERER